MAVPARPEAVPAGSRLGWEAIACASAPAFPSSQSGAAPWATLRIGRHMNVTRRVVSADTERTLRHQAAGSHRRQAPKEVDPLGRLPPHHIRRPRLTSQCLQASVVVVEAAAGYGKTVL